MKAVFLGDSFTSGENNDQKSFVSYLNYFKNIENFGISGTTVGDYSIYPVGNKHLTALLQEPEVYYAILNADYLFLEYGINDVSSLFYCSDHFQLSKYMLDINKSLDKIYQINSNIKIIFLSLFDINNTYALQRYAEKQCEYLTSYLPFYPRKIEALEWVNLYITLVAYTSKYNLSVIPMFKNSDELFDNLDVDMLHPNNDGYKIIAKNILQAL